VVGVAEPPGRSPATLASHVDESAREERTAANAIHLVMHTLNTRRRKTLTDVFGDEAGGEIWSRFTVTTHPSIEVGANQAEMENSPPRIETPFASLQQTMASPWRAPRSTAAAGRRPVFMFFGRECRILVRAHGSVAPGNSSPGGTRIPLRGAQIRFRSKSL